MWGMKAVVFITQVMYTFCCIKNHVPQSWDDLAWDKQGWFWPLHSQRPPLVGQVIASNSVKISGYKCCFLDCRQNYMYIRNPRGTGRPTAQPAEEGSTLPVLSYIPSPSKEGTATVKCSFCRHDVCMFHFWIKQRNNSWAFYVHFSFFFLLFF